MKRQSHNSIERKRKDKLKLAIDDIRKLLPETDFNSSKKQVCKVKVKLGYSIVRFKAYLRA